MSATQRRLRAHGLSCAVPSGWDVRIEQRVQSSVSTPASNVPTGGYVHPTLHAATSALPSDRGDYGSGYVERMRNTDVFLCLGEFDHEAGATEMFDEGLPSGLRAGEFHPDAQQRVIAGMCGVQRFFHTGGRAFCLYVVLGSWAQRKELAQVASSFLSTIQVEPR